MNTLRKKKQTGNVTGSPLYMNHNSKKKFRGCTILGEMRWPKMASDIQGLYI